MRKIKIEENKYYVRSFGDQVFFCEYSNGHWFVRNMRNGKNRGTKQGSFRMTAYNILKGIAF